MKLIDGKALAETIKDKVAAEISSFSGPRPGLAIILVGERPDSKLYVGLKEKQAKAVGIDTHLYRCPENVTQEELVEMITFLNADDAVDAILIQLPLPAHLDTGIIVNTIATEKDVDGFTKQNLDRLMGVDAAEAVMPPVYGVILSMLASIGYGLSGKQVRLIVNSDIFEQNLAETLRRQGGELTADTKTADVIITAVGKENSLTADMVKDDAVIIDIGITQHEDGSVHGDVNADSMKDKPGYLSPVPGGVGPMTIAMAFWNTLQIFKKRHNK